MIVRGFAGPVAGLSRVSTRARRPLTLTERTSVDDPLKTSASTLNESRAVERLVGLELLRERHAELLARVAGQPAAERLAVARRSGGEEPLDRLGHPLLLGDRVLERADVGDRERDDDGPGDEQERRDPPADDVGHGRNLTTRTIGFTVWKSARSISTTPWRAA